MAWKIVERLCFILGTLFAAVSAYYAVATYYDWNNQQATWAPGGSAVVPPWWPLVVAAIGIALLGTAWAMIAQRLWQLRIVHNDNVEARPDNRDWFSGYNVWKLADPEIVQSAERAEAALRDSQYDLGQCENELRDHKKDRSSIRSIRRELLPRPIKRWKS